MEPENISQYFLELSSEQRIRILLKLKEEKLNLSKFIPILEASSSEVHRNLKRLEKSGLINKNSDGIYGLTHYGSVICKQIPSLFFIPENKNFFSDHTFEGLPTKYIQRLGALENKTHIKGYVRVLEKWKLIHSNAEKYIFNFLPEVPYTKEIIDVVLEKLKKGLMIHSIFSEDTIVPDERTASFGDKGFQKYVKNQNLQRRMQKTASVTVLLNEKEAAIFFPKLNGEPDLSQMFYSANPDFHEWCYDFFCENWEMSSSFQETKLK